MENKDFVKETNENINDILVNDVAMHKTNIINVLNESTLLQHFLNTMVIQELQNRLLVFIKNNNLTQAEILLNQWINSWKISIDQLAVDMDLLPDVKNHLFDVSKKTSVLIRNLLIGE